MSTLCICCRGFDWSLFWSFVTALSTVGLLSVAWKQLSEFNRTTKFDFYHRLTHDFFSNKSRELIMLLEYKALAFEKGDKIDIEEWGEAEYCPYYKIRKDIVEKLNKQIKLLDDKKEIYTLFEVEDFLLNQIEDLSFLLKKGVLDFEQISNGFGVYIEIIFSNNEIQNHIKYLREEDNDNSIYEGCDKLYSMITSQHIK